MPEWIRDALQWAADKLGLVSNAPWLHPAVGFILNVSAAIIAWWVTELPWPNIALTLAIVLAAWGFVAALAGREVGIVASLAILIIGLGIQSVLLGAKKSDDEKIKLACAEWDGQPILDCKKPPAK